MVIAHGEGGEFADATCPKETPLAIGGGSAVDDKGGFVSISAPITGHELSGDGQQPTGWRVRVGSGAYTSYAICTKAGAKEAPGEGEEEIKK